MIGRFPDQEDILRLFQIQQGINQFFLMMFVPISGPRSFRDATQLVAEPSTKYEPDVI